MLPLREYQRKAIEDLRAALANGKRRPVMMAPTGWGKTRLGAELVGSALAKRKRTVFCVPAISLIDQTVRAFWNEGIRDVGVIQADHSLTDWSRPIQVASVQTIARRGFPQCDLVIIDECHRVFETYWKWMEEAKSVPFIGLSATPWTKGLGQHFDHLIISATTGDLIEQGYLSPFRVFAPSHPDLSAVRVRAGDYVEEDLSAAMDKVELVGDVVETWIKLGEDRPTLCFAVDCAHAQHLQEKFVASGIPAAYQDAHTTSVEREIIRKHFAEGKVKVVCNVGTLTTGVDWDVRCIILARPTRSEMLFVQIVGRGLRTAQGKENCLLLDHSDTHARLGFVTDIGHETLDDGRKKSSDASERKAPLPKECPKCAFLRPPRVRVCPNCGFEVVTQPNVRHVDGGLEELTGVGRALPGKTIALRGREFTHAEFFGALRRYATEHAYKPGWAYWKFKEAVGRDPPREAEECDVAEEIASWIKSRQIRWAKRRRAEETGDAASAS